MIESIPAVFVGIGAYWVTGILAKGIFEPIQARMGRRLFRLLHHKALDIDRQVSESCNQIDDLLLGHVPDLFNQLAPIIDPQELSPGDRQLFREQLDRVYSLAKLLEKTNQPQP